jgi:guanylate kinase
MTDGVCSNALLIVLSGPSGVGKDSVIACLKSCSFPIHYTVTVTTRAPRPGEVNGVDYFFAEGAEFDRMAERGDLLESAVVHGYRYGTPREQVRQALGAGRDVLLKIDVQGAAQVRRKAPEAVFIFLAPATLVELVERLRARATESGPDLERRLLDIQDEMDDLPHYDYVVVNRRDRLEDTVEQVKAIITAEHCRVQRRHIAV